MFPTRSVPIYAVYALQLLFAVAIGYVAHELAHWAMDTLYGYSAVVDWRAGYVSVYDASGNLISRDTMPPVESVLITLAGPLMTLLLAAGFTALYSQRPGSFMLFSLAIMNAVSRFNIFIDGINSDEGKIASVMAGSFGALGRMAAFTVPLLVWTACIILSYKLINRQGFFRRTYWAIPLWMIINTILVLLMRALIGLVWMS